MCQILFWGKQTRKFFYSNSAYILVKREMQEIKHTYTTGATRKQVKEMSRNKGKLSKEDGQERCLWGSDI